MSSPEREWFTCEESGVKFQYPDGKKCRNCKRMVSTPYYLYESMEAVCLKCRKKEIQEILESLKG